MLIQFSVENFMSIRDKVVLSMLKGAGDEHLDNFTKINKSQSTLNTVAIYGANASGKSNLFKALTAAIIFVRQSNFMNINQKNLAITPFKFNNENIKAPSKFEFIFMTKGIKYAYGFSADQDKIYEEYLYQYLTAKPSKIFERKNTNEYIYTLSEQRELASIIERNTENKLLLTTATTWNYEKTKDPYLWFAEEIDTFSDYKSLTNISFEKYEKDITGDLKKFTLNLMKESDINIDDYNIDRQDMIKENITDPILFNLMKNNPEGFIKAVTRKVTTEHYIEDEKGNKKEVPSLNLIEESEGTINLFFLGPLLKETLEKGKTMIIDEIDKSLHPLLVKYIIELFHNKNINRNGAQLIFNTHDTNLLSLETFRRDQLYFAEKNHKTGESTLFALDEFSVRKKENVNQGYLNGRYGAIPLLGLGSNLWE